MKGLGVVVALGMLGCLLTAQGVLGQEEESCEGTVGEVEVNAAGHVSKPGPVGVMYKREHIENANDLELREGSNLFLDKTTEDSLEKRGLLHWRMPYEKIKHNHNLVLADFSKREFDGPTLGYVTPWNPVGYAAAYRWACRFDMISPAWHIVEKRDKVDTTGAFLFEATGLDLVDVEWMADVKQNAQEQGCPKPKIIPRFLLDQWTGEFMKTVIHTPTSVQSFTLAIASTVEEYGYDGFVLDCAYIFADINFKRELPSFLSFLQKLHQYAQTRGLEFIMVVPPFLDREFINNLLFAADYINILTYDSPTYGAVAPYDWIRETVENMNPSLEHDVPVKDRRILMGLNFYGYMENSKGKINPVTGADVLEIMEVNAVRRMTWHEEYREHYIDGPQDVIVTFPSVKSLSERVELANELEVGIAVWDLGQGLSYFFDVL